MHTISGKRLPFSPSFLEYFFAHFLIKKLLEDDLLAGVIYIWDLGNVKTAAL